jgi:hypothetical protein
MNTNGSYYNYFARGQQSSLATCLTFARATFHYFSRKKTNCSGSFSVA